MVNDGVGISVAQADGTAIEHVGFGGPRGVKRFAGQGVEFGHIGFGVNAFASNFGPCNIGLKMRK